MEGIDPGDPLSYSLATVSVLAFLAANGPDVLAAAFFIVSLLLCSALTSGAEVAFFSLSEEELQQFEQSSHSTDKRVLHLLEHPRRLLATILVLNHIINLGIITATAWLAWPLLVNKPTSYPVSLMVLVLLLTGGIVFFGEVIPKTYAANRRLGLTRRLGKAMYFFQKLLYPLTSVLLRFSFFVEKRFKHKAYHTAVDELHQAIEASVTDDASAEEKTILKGLVTFSSISAKQIMCSRQDMIAFSTAQSLPELIPLINQWEYSRVPVYSDTIDKIEGILYIKDLLPYLDSGPLFKWQKLIRPPFFVPENKRIDDLLRDFQDSHVHMAIVADEYGGTVGLVTLEDVIEEIVGEIHDEFDLDEDILYSQLDENTFVFEGKASIHDFCKITGVPFDSFDEVKGENESVGGLLLNLFGRLPRLGDEIEFGRFTFVIESVDNKRIKRIKAHVADTERTYNKAV